MYPIPQEIALNDVKYYQAKTNSKSFFTGYNVYSILWLSLGYPDQALVALNRTWLFIQPPFNVWREKLQGGHQNFITGNILY